jgi:hypothetical protein
LLARARGGYCFPPNMARLARQSCFKFMSSRRAHAALDDDDCCDADATISLLS